LFATVLTLTLAARAEAEGPDPDAAPRPAWLLPLAALATVATFGQAVLGGLVSTHHAGLACPDWPTCNGEWLPPLVGGVALQVFHRFGAYALVILVWIVAVRARTAPDPGIRAGGVLASSLVLAQVVLGVCNVLLGTPVWLSALHLATAMTILAMLVTITFRTAALPAAAGRLAPAPAR
jgi:cytochrome c oxidase assembly protein subunit 15